MITDGVDDVAAARDVAKAEVLDVAQLLLGSLDKSSVTLPEKGTAAKEAEERAARVEASAPAVEAEEEAEAEPETAAAPAAETPRQQPSPSPASASPAAPNAPAPRRPPPLTQPRPTKSPQRQQHP